MIQKKKKKVEERTIRTDIRFFMIRDSTQIDVLFFFYFYINL